MINLLRKLFFIIKNFKINKFEEQLSNKKSASLSSQNLFDPRLKIYMFGTDLFHDKVMPLINYFNFSFFYSKLFNYCYKNYPNSFFTKWLIKNRIIGYFKIIDSSNGEIVCIRNFL